MLNSGLSAIHVLLSNLYHCPISCNIGLELAMVVFISSKAIISGGKKRRLELIGKHPEIASVYVPDFEKDIEQKSKS